MSWFPILLKAMHIANKAVEEDRNKNYAEAVKLYEQSEGYFVYVIKHEAHTDEAKDVVRSKLKMYQDRTKILSAHLAKKEISYRRRQSCPYFRPKAQKPRAGSPRPCDNSHPDNKLKSLSLKDDTESQTCR